MNEPKYSKCSCRNCGGHIAFPMHGAGTTVACPHCSQKTVLTIPKPAPAQEVPPPRSSRMPWIVSVIVLVALAGVGGFFYGQKAQTKKALTPSASLKSPPNSPAKSKPAEAADVSSLSTNQLRVGNVTLEKTKNSSVVFAVGLIKNESDRQRFGLKIELDLLDTDGLRIGTATDYLAILEPRKDWRFKALVLEAKAATARLAAITEDQ